MINQRIHLHGLHQQQDLKRILNSLSDDLVDKFMEVERYNARYVVEEARLLSSGPYSTNELRRMGHPYAKRHVRLGGIFLDPSRVNKQTGEFWRLWVVNGPKLVSGNVETSVGNRSPESRFILNPGGTKKMVERPLLQRVISRVATRIYQNRRDVIRRLLEEVHA